MQEVSDITGMTGHWEAKKEMNWMDSETNLTGPSSISSQMTLTFSFHPESQHGYCDTPRLFPWQAKLGIRMHAHMLFVVQAPVLVRLSI
jgi:hypothetical protein